MSTTDSAGLIYAYNAISDGFYRYAAGTTGSGSWATLAGQTATLPATVSGPMCSADSDRIINNTSPIWAKAPLELKDEDYLKFYKELYPFSASYALSIIEEA